VSEKMGVVHVVHWLTPARRAKLRCFPVGKKRSSSPVSRTVLAWTGPLT